MIEIDDDAFLSSVPRWIIFQWPGHGKGKGWEIRQWTRIGRHGNCGGVRPALDPMPHESGWRLLAKSPSLSTPADVTPIIRHHIRGFRWEISPYFKYATFDIKPLKFACQIGLLIPFTSVANLRI